MDRPTSRHAEQHTTSADGSELLLLASAADEPGGTSLPWFTVRDLMRQLLEAGVVGHRWLSSVPSPCQQLTTLKSDPLPHGPILGL